MLQVLVFCLFYMAILKALHSSFVSKLYKSKTLSEACRIRRNWKIVRYLSIVILATINFLFSFLVQVYQNDGDIVWLSIIISTIVSTIICFILPVFSKSFSEFNPVSFLTMDRIKKDEGKSIILFLRGFNTDNYSSKYGSTGEISSIESILNWRLSSRLYAVGMTKELNSPIGAKRIYLEEEHWKEDVLYLMERSSSIFILVNSKESCVWEIQQALERYPSKTCFIINDVVQYFNVQEKLKGYGLPNIITHSEKLDCAHKNVAFILHPPVEYSIQGTNDYVLATIYSISPNKEGYDHLISDLYGQKSLIQKNKNRRIILSIIATAPFVLDIIMRIVRAID